MSPFLLFPIVQLRGGCVAVAVAFRVLSCVAVAFRVLCCVAVALRVLRCVAVAFRCASGLALRPRRSCYVSGGFSLPRRASPYWFRAPPSTKSAFLCAFWLRDPHFPAFRAQNWHFCVRMGDFSEIFGRFDTKMGFLCSGSITMVVPANHRAHFKNVNPL